MCENLLAFDSSNGRPSKRLRGLDAEDPSIAAKEAALRSHLCVAAIRVQACVARLCFGWKIKTNAGSFSAGHRQTMAEKVAAHGYCDGAAS